MVKKVSQIHESELMYLLHKIHRMKHFDCTKYKLTTLKRRIDRRLFATNTKNYYQYAYYLDKYPEEYDNFLNDLTINVTNFFRDKEVFEFLKKDVLPILISGKQKTTTKRIRIWSAGCAGGEETYSIAIMLSELLGARVNNFNISIWGTDLDNKSLEQAKKGEYEQEMISNLDPTILSKYFEYSNGKFKVKEEIKSSVRFRKHDLINDLPMKCFDLILCRNVLIYFNRQFQSKLFQAFFNGLNRYGFLVLGKSEMPNQEILDRLEQVSKRNCVFRKREVENG